MLRIAYLPLYTTILALACTTTDRDGGSSFGEGAGDQGDGEPGATGSEENEGAGDDGDDGGDGGDGGDDGDGDDTHFDVGSGESGGPGDAPTGCEKVDFLFVIDASPSMEAEQAQLVAAFPGFVAAMRDTLQAQDYHVLVTDTDAHPQYSPNGGNGFCDDGSCCDSVRWQDPQNNWCNNEPCVDHSGECDFMLGAGKNVDADWQSCNIPSDARWLEGNEAQLDSMFACVATVGTIGHYNETQAAAAFMAVDDSLGDGGACNEGFLRDDAVLVVTLISDEEDGQGPDTGSDGDPPDWYDALVAAKGGDASAIVMLGLVGDYGQPGSPCLPYDPTGSGAQDAPRLRELVSMFGDRGLLGSVCADDYVPFFDEAVGLIDTACDEYTPPG